MSDTGGLIVYKIIGWKITTMEIKGGARAYHSGYHLLNILYILHRLPGMF